MKILIIAWGAAIAVLIVGVPRGDILALVAVVGFLFLVSMLEDWLDAADNNHSR